MSKKATLRAVEPGEVPARKLTLSEAIETGSYMDILVAQRTEIVESIPHEKGPAKAALHRQLSLISKEIESLKVRESGDVEFGSEEADDFDVAAI